MCFMQRGLSENLKKNWPDPNLYLIVQQLKCALQNRPQKNDVNFEQLYEY